MFKVIILEDNILMQESLKEILIADPELQVTGVYPNAHNIVRIYEQYKPDIVVTDLDMPGGDGLTGLLQLKEKFPDARVMIFTVFEDNDMVLKAICQGANGYVMKSSEPRKIIEAVKDVLQGGAPLTPHIASKILRYFPKKSVIEKNELESLSLKEKHVLDLLVKGYSYKMISFELGKSIETVKVQIKNIYRKLNVKSNSEAILKSLRQG